MCVYKIVRKYMCMYMHRILHHVSNQLMATVPVFALQPVTWEQGGSA